MGGGVFSVIRNLLLYKQHTEIENHVIYTINKDKVKNYNLPGLKGATSEQVFYYSVNWNFYYTCRQLAKLLSDENAIIVAHDWLELGMVSNLGLQTPVVQFLHGDYGYYYDLALKNQSNIDLFISVSQNIQLTLQMKIPERVKEILYVRFPVPESFAGTQKYHNEKNIVFIGRLTHEKGYYLLPEIANKLNETNTHFKWHIIGSNAKSLDSQNIWDKNINVSFYGEIENDQVAILLSKMDFYILPSLAEGMPLSLIEAMKAGVLPFVNDLAGGINELVENDVTGFKIRNNNIGEFAKKIQFVTENEVLYLKLKEASKKKADNLFDPIKNTYIFESHILGMKKPNLKTSKKVYGSRMDERWVPNVITRLSRILK